MEEELPDADLNIGRDILGIIDALPFGVLLIDAHHYILLCREKFRCCNYLPSMLELEQLSSKAVRYAALSFI